MKSVFHQKAPIDKRPFTQAIFVGIAVVLLGWGAPTHAQELITNGSFTDGLTGWSPTDWGTGGSSGLNANGPTDTSAASGNYAYAGGGVGTLNLLTQSISGVTTGNAYRLTFLAGGKSGQGNANGVLSLHDGLAGGPYNSASFDYNPSDAAFGSYTVDFTARGATDLWLRSDSTYAAYDNVSVTPIASVENALNYSSASGFSQISSALTGSGKVTVAAGTGGLTLAAANTHTGGTEVTGGILYVNGAGTLGATGGAVTVSGGGILDLRNQQILTGTISMNNQNAKIISASSTGSIVNNGGAFQFGGGSLEVPMSGTGGLNVTGGGQITSANSYTGATTISGTTGWFGTDQLFVANANALGAATGDLTISGGYVNLLSNTITRSGNVTVSGGTIENGTLSKSGSNYDIQGGSVGASLAGTAGLTKSGSATAALGGANTYSGGTTINGGTLSVYSAGGLGDAAGAVTISNTVSTATLDLRNAQTRTGTITMIGQGARLASGDVNNPGSLINNGSALEMGGGQITVSVSGNGGLNVTGGGTINSSNSYTGATTISGTTGWYGTDQLFVNNANALGAADGDLTISGGRVNLQDNTISRSGNVTISGGTLSSPTIGTLEKTGGVFALQGGNGSVGVVLAGTAGLTKSGAGTNYLYSSNTYTGATTISGGTLVTDGEGQLTAGTTLAISNGATWQMTGAFSSNGATRTIGGLTGDGTVQTTTSGFTHNLAVDKASGTTDIFNGVIAGSGALIKRGAGTLVLGGTNSYSGATEVNVGTLVISNTSLSATILSNSIAVVFSSPPSAGMTYPILPGALAGNSLVSQSVTGLGSGQTATVVNDPNLVVEVTGGSTNPTFEDAYPSIDPLAVNPANGLTYLMNYALGGTGPNSTPALPVLTVDGNGLTLTATVRNDDPSLRFYGQWTTDLSGTTDSWEDHTVELTPPDLSFSQDVETNKPRKFMRLKVTRQ